MAVKLPDDVFDRINLERYGIGVPVVLAMLAVALLWRAFTGINIYYQLTLYGKLGVVVLLVAQALCFLAAGYTYTYVDTDQWLLTEEEDKEPLLEADGE